MPTVERVSGLSAIDASAFASIYESAFPPEERIGTESLLADVASPATPRHGWVVRRAGHLAGLAVAVDLDDTDAVLLEYLAVDPARRSAGLGSRLLHSVCDDVRASRPGVSTIVLEVEPPAAGAGSRSEAVRRDRERRGAFYRANGAVPVDTAGAYEVPAFGAGGTLRFDLLALPLSSGGPPVAGPALHRCVAAILRASYGLPGDDPRVGAVLTRLPPAA